MYFFEVITAFLYDGTSDIVSIPITAFLAFLRSPSFYDYGSAQTIEICKVVADRKSNFRVPGMRAIKWVSKF